MVFIPSPQTEYAFPLANDMEKEYHWIHRGMTLRDWFAGQALPAVLAGDYSADPEDQQTYEALVDIAYGIADKMLARREDET